MKMKYFKILSTILLALVFSMSSCDFLDVEDYYDDTLKYDSIFANKRNLEKYMWAVAANFPDEANFLQNNYTPGPLATDEGIVTFDANEFRGIAFILGQVTSSDLKGMDNWGSMYGNIRKMNILLSRMDEAKDLTPTDKVEMTSYARFIRAYSYYHLAQNFGPLILVGDRVIENNEDAEYYNLSRATYDETIDYICSEFEAAAVHMPTNIPVNKFGRPSQGAAYGLIARLRLQQASPLFNGGDAAKRTFGSWTRLVDGKHYVSQTYDERKWAVAAAAAKRIIESRKYQLHIVEKGLDTPELPPGVPTADYPNGAGGIDPFRSYSEMFNGETLGQQNKEYLWGRMSGAVANTTKHCFPKTLLGGVEALNVTQKVVDAYRTADGKDKTAADEIGMSPGGAIKFSGYTLNGGISNMYTNREMRFYASIGFNRRFWTCSSCTENGRHNITINYNIGGNAQREDLRDSNYNLTGYVLTKYIHPEDAWTGTGNRRVEKSFGIIRYAEILLAYVEAMNNLTQEYDIPLPGVDGDVIYKVSRDEKEMSYNFNLVRFRAGLPGPTPAELSDVKVLQSLLERELMVEFLFENRRYFDVRRWGIYETVDAEPVEGMNMAALDESEFYQRTVVNHRRTRDRVTDRKMIFLPIHKDEIRRVRNLDQNPRWDN